MDYKKLNLGELISKVKAKEDGAFDELYERYVRLVYYIAHKICVNDADSKDIVQETFMEVQRSIHSLQNPDAFKFWLNRIVLSKTKNLFRKNKYSFMDDEQLAAQHLLVENRSYMIPEKNSRKSSDKEVLSEFIDSLPSVQKQVLVLFYLEQFSIQEVAELMDVPEGTVKSRLSYARASMRKYIEQYEKENGIHLNFHSLGETITTIMLAEVAAIHIPKTIMLFSLVPKKWLSSFQSVVSTSLVKAVLIVGCVGGVAGGGAYVIQEMKQQSELSKTAIQPQVIQTEEKTFPKIQVLGKEINTSKAAYFNILYVACCEEEIKQLTPEQLQDIKVMYTTLKDVDSPYYQSLVDEGFISVFDNLTK